MDADMIEPSADFSAEGEEGAVECNKDDSDAQQCIMDQQPVPSSEDSIQNTTADQIDEKVNITASEDASSQLQDVSEDQPLDQLAEVVEQASAAEPMETEGEVAEVAKDGEDQILYDTGEAAQPESESVEQGNMTAPSEQMFAETGKEDGAGMQDLSEAGPTPGNVETLEEALPPEPDDKIAAEREAEDGAVGDAGGDNFCNMSAEEEDKLLADDGREGEGVPAVGQDSDQSTGLEQKPDTDILKDPDAELMDTAEENETMSPEKIEVNTSSETEGDFKNSSELTENVENQHCVEENTPEDPKLEGTESESIENSAEKEKDTQQLADEQEQSTKKGDDEEGKTNSDSAVTETHGDSEVQPANTSNISDVSVTEDRTVTISDDVLPGEAEASPCQVTTPASHNTSSSVTVPPTQAKPQSSSPVPVDDDDDDVVVLEDYVSPPKVEKESLEKEVFNNNNDMGIQIASVSGGAEELHKMADQHQVKQENGDVMITSFTNSSSMKSPAAVPSGTPVSKKSTTKSQSCIVCKRVGKCKYNIVRNGDVKHLCDDTCFKRFRTNPSMFLKGSASSKPVGSTASSTPSQRKGRPAKSKAATVVTPAVQARTPTPSFKTCVVCQIMNVNNQGQFCTWKGMDFCGEECLGKFQSGISTNCTLCKVFIPLTARSANCLKLGNEIHPFCSTRCYSDYKQYTRLCTYCHNDLSKTMDSFSAPVGPESIFKEFCSQDCMRQFESRLNSDVEIIKVVQGKQKSTTKCSVCSKLEKTKHAIKFAGVVHALCSDTCLSAFRYANQLDLNTCHYCKTICSSLEASPHTIIFEGDKKRFCSDACVSKYRLVHRKVVTCSWCGSLRDNFDMIERLDSSSKYQLFCSLNCLSLFRVNLQAKSNQAVMCDFCRKMVPAQYHLTMSDASVRNFCSYNCVMSFQSQFTKATTSEQLTTTAAAPLTTHKHNTRRSNQQKSPTPPSVPVISNVISLAPQGNQTVNTKNSAGSLVVGKGNSAKKGGSQGTNPPVNQKIIIQPPPPKVMKNKALMCKPFTQTKGTSCRPHSTAKECQTETVRDKPTMIPVPVPIYLPAPMALYSNPAPTPIFIPVPIPVPVFIPTTRKSANGIMKQIKEIAEKTPSDPLEAELLQMAAAVSGESTTIASESDAEDKPLPEISKSRKRPLPVEDEGGEQEMEEDGEGGDNVLPLTNQREDGEEDMISMALRMAEEITDLETAVEAMPVSSEAPPTATESSREEEPTRPRVTRRNPRGASRAKRPRLQAPAEESSAPVAMVAEPVTPPVDLNHHLKFSYGVNAWRHWVMFKNTQLEQSQKAGGGGRVKFFKSDILQCTADELNFALCLFVKEVRKPSGDEYSPDSIYYLTLGLQEYLYENGRIDNIFADHYYEPFTQQLTEILSTCQPKYNHEGQMVCRIEEEHLWECKQLGAHSPYVLLNTLIFFHTKFFMLKTPEEHLKLSFAHILKYWKKGHQQGKGGQASSRSVSLRYYSVSSARKDASAAVSTTKRGSRDGIPVYEVVDNPNNPLRCPVKLYEFFLSKCPESIKNRSDIFYPVPERSCVPDSPVWYSTMPLGQEVLTGMLTRILLVREIQEAHLHSRPIYV